MAIDIRAQPLADALNAWARQTGLQVIAAQHLVAGRDASAVVGRMTPLQALDQLLGGSGLGHSVEGNAVIIREARSGASTPMLPAVTVRANVITADEIAIQNSRSVADALRYTAGANPMGGGLSNVSDTMILRSFNIGFNPIYLNGARLSRNTFVGTSEPYAMERIELLKGPAPVMYGTSVPGGGISMASKLPQRDAARELQVQLGSDTCVDRIPNGRIPRSRCVGEPGFDRHQTINRTFSWLLRHEINDSLSFRQTFPGYVGRANYSNIWIGALEANERVIVRGVDQRTSSNHSWSHDNHLEARWRSGAVEHTTLVGLDISPGRLRPVDPQRHGRASGPVFARSSRPAATRSNSACATSRAAVATAPGPRCTRSSSPI